MITPPRSLEDFARFRQERAAKIRTVGAGDDDWMSTLSKIAPMLSGVGAFGSFVNSVIAARETAAFQKELISALQTIEADLEGIKADLDAIFQELKKIETQIAGLGLNDKLTAIETWGMELAALDPDDKPGAGILASAMMDASQGATNLLACMVGLHDALVGQDIGEPLITLLDPASVLQIRARLVQGLHLLAFGCAFNTVQYDYGVFLLQWAANFEQQAQFYFAAAKDVIAIVEFPPPSGGGGGPLHGGDTIVIYQYAQSSLDNVSIAVDGQGELLGVYTGTLAAAVSTDTGRMVLAYPNTGVAIDGWADMVGNQTTTDPLSPLWMQGNPFYDANRYMWFFLNPLLGFMTQQFGDRGKLVSGARFDQNQTLLGAVNGQVLFIRAADETPFICSIHDGENTAASLLAYDATKGAVSAIPRGQLKSLPPALWAVSWVDKNVVTIAALQPDSAPPAYLSLDGGNWTIGKTPVNLTVKAADATIGPITNPFKMPPTTATIAAAGSNRTVLFHQL